MGGAQDIEIRVILRSGAGFATLIERGQRHLGTDSAGDLWHIEPLLASEPDGAVVISGQSAGPSDAEHLATAVQQLDPSGHVLVDEPNPILVPAKCEPTELDLRPGRRFGLRRSGRGIRVGVVANHGDAAELVQAVAPGAKVDLLEPAGRFGSDLVRALARASADLHQVVAVVSTSPRLPEIDRLAHDLERRGTVVLAEPDDPTNAAGWAALWLAQHGRRRLLSRVGRPAITATFRAALLKQSE